MRKTFLITLLLIFAIMLSLPSSGLAEPGTIDGSAGAYSDLFIGAPRRNVNPGTGIEYDAGSVSVLYGKSDGLQHSNQYLTQDGVNGTNPEQNDRFGSSLALGDFNGDGYKDLAVGTPDEDIGSNPLKEAAGAVNVFYSTGGGFSSSNTDYWNQDEDGMGGIAEKDDHFGEALAAGDFNQDGYDDLVIGVPGEDTSFGNDAGVMMVLNGTAAGLEASTTIWSRGSQAGDYELFGCALATGDFDNDGYDDLAVGIPGEDLNGKDMAGAVQLYYGSSSGLIVIHDTLWSQLRTDIFDDAEEGDKFGWTLAAGDLNCDGYDDLAIGVPYEDITSTVTITDAGAVNVLYGSVNGISGSGDDFWHQNVGSVQSSCEEGDKFGYALTAGDFDGNGCFDLAIGSPYEDWGTVNDSGIVQILYSTSSGLDDFFNQLWHQDITGVPDTVEEDDWFGYALAAGNFNGDGYDDLAIGVPLEDINDTTVLTNTGMVVVLYGIGSGITSEDAESFTQSLNPYITAEAGDRFGSALAAVPGTRQLIYLPFTVR
jgi:hypothetical protein